MRLYLVNTANTRIFNFAVRGARTKLVGGDSGRYERETWVDEVLLAPSERAVLDVLFDAPGEVRLEHRTPDHVYDLGAFSVSGTSTGTASGSFADLRVDPELTGEHQSIQEDLTRPPDKVLAFVSSMPLLYGGDIQTSSYACPMHPEVTDSKPGTCPKCGMQLVPVQTESPERSAYVCPMHPEVTDSKPGTCPKCGMKLVPGAGGNDRAIVLLRLPHAPGSHGLEAWYLPEVRDETGAFGRGANREGRSWLPSRARGRWP